MNVLLTIRNLISCIVIPLRLVYERVYAEKNEEI